MDEANVEPVDFGIRAVGRLIDYGPTLLAGVVSGAALALIAGAIGGATRRPDSVVFAAMTKTSPLTYLGGLLATTVYHAFSESIGGASLGKRLLGLEVVSENLQPATLLQGLKRDIGFFVDALFFGVVAIHYMNQSPIKQRLGDRWGKTRVVRRRSLPLELRRPTRIFVFVFLAAVALAVETLVAAHLCSYWLLT